MADESILHFGLARIRVTGSGALKLIIKGYDSNPSFNLAPITMQLGPGRESDRLCNLSNQRAQLRVYVTDLNEYFRINRIVLFAKTIYNQYPGV